MENKEKVLSKKNQNFYQKYYLARKYLRVKSGLGKTTYKLNFLTPSK